MTLSLCNADFRIPDHTIREIQSSIVELLQKGGTYRNAHGIITTLPRAVSSIASTLTLDQLFALDGWKLLYTKYALDSHYAYGGEGDCVGIELMNTEKTLRGFEDVLFCLIAPSVQPGSFLEMDYRTEEERKQWRWVFEGGRCHYVTPRLVWETPVWKEDYIVSFTASGTMVVQAESKEEAQALGTEAIQLFSTTHPALSECKINTIETLDVEEYN